MKEKLNEIFNLIEELDIFEIENTELVFTKNITKFFIWCSKQLMDKANPKGVLYNDYLSRDKENIDSSDFVGLGNNTYLYELELLYKEYNRGDSYPKYYCVNISPQWIYDENYLQEEIDRSIKRKNLELEEKKSKDRELLEQREKEQYLKLKEKYGK